MYMRVCVCMCKKYKTDAWWLIMDGYHWKKEVKIKNLISHIFLYILTQCIVFIIKMNIKVFKRIFIGDFLRQTWQPEPVCLIHSFSYVSTEGGNCREGRIPFFWHKPWLGALREILSGESSEGHRKTWMIIHLPTVNWCLLLWAWQSNQ